MLFIVRLDFAEYILAEYRLFIQFPRIFQDTEVETVPFFLDIVHRHIGSIQEIIVLLRGLFQLGHARLLDVGLFSQLADLILQDYDPYPLNHR